MNLSAKVEYACIAVIELAEHYSSDEPLRVRDIADRHGIPSRFLVQILLQLKAAGLVQSARGATGGYYLARTPEQISLAEVMAVIEGPLGDVESNIDPVTPAANVLAEVWNKAAAAQRETLEAISFADLAERLRSQPEEMYHI